MTIIAGDNETNLDKFALRAHEFLNHKTTLILMTLIIAVCTSTFAFTYGQTFNWQYALLFFFALVALTFHFTQFFPEKVVAALRCYAVVGLVLLSMFVAIAAWLNAATSTSDSGLADLDKQISAKESEITSAETGRILAVMSGKEVDGKSVSVLQGELGELYRQRRSISDGSNTYEVGNMAVFGHLQAVTGWHQKQVDLLVMWLVVSVLLAMELSMGYAITGEDGPGK